MLNRQRGFTIIEIMTVLVIIGILAAIAIPLMHGYQMRAKNTQAISDIYNLNLFENQFYSNHHEYASVAASDKSTNGQISKNITLLNGDKALFEASGLTSGVYRRPSQPTLPVKPLYWALWQREAAVFSRWIRMQQTAITSFH